VLQRLASLLSDASHVHRGGERALGQRHGRVPVVESEPALFCSASGSAGDAPLLLETEKLSLLEGAALGAVRLVFGDVQIAVQEGNASLLPEDEKLSLLEGATLAPAPLYSVSPLLCRRPPPTHHPPPPCRLISPRVSTLRLAPRAPPQRRGRRAKRSTQWGRQPRT